MAGASRRAKQIMKTQPFALLLWLAAAWVVSIPAITTASPELDLARQLNRAFIEVAEKASPAVVVVNVVEKPGASSPDWFDDETDASPNHKLRPQKSEKIFGQGSGVIIRNDGYIITNNHVVEDAEKIEIKMRDGRTFPAEIRGRDAASDLAVLKIKARDLPVARLADSSRTRVGEFAIAIGAPFSLDYSVTFGHVSAKGRSNIVPDWEDGGAMDQDFIQTDANINPGNSGGPLLNIDSEVIGINTLIRGLHTGIGFAIPSNLAREISDKLIADGKITRPWLGVKIHSVADDPDFHELMPDVDSGVIVQSISPGGPAAKSGLRPADVITAIDGKSVGNSQQIRDEVRRKTIGQLVTLDVLRAGKAIQLKLKTEPELDVAATTNESFAAESAAAANLGLTVHPVTRQLTDHFGVNMTEGVIVVAVDKNGPAAQNEIKPGDIITSVNQQPVANPKQFHDALKKADLKKGVLLNLTNRDESWFEILHDSGD
jgi:serine protease Do